MIRLPIHSEKQETLAFYSQYTQATRKRAADAAQVYLGDGDEDDGVCSLC